MSASLSPWRSDFPGLDQEIRGRRLVYLDSAATTQRPREVLEAMDGFYRHDNANVHRGVHTLSQRATDHFEAARNRVARFINAREDAEIILTKGCTEAINLAAHSWGRFNLNPGDVILLSTMEHHANIVPWQISAEMTGAKIIPIPISDNGEIILEEYEGLLRENPVRLVGVKQVCNALGTINPIAEMTRLAHEYGALILVDAAQGLAHGGLDVRATDVDFAALSAHKVYGPMGVGALYGKRELLENMPPYQSGGDMIRTVSFEKTTYNVLPNRLESGTPNVAGVIGWGAALDWLTRQTEVEKHENELLQYGANMLSEIPGVRIVGTAKKKAAILSFVVEGIHPHDLGTILDSDGVAVRAGHHCCMPLMQRMGLPATVRASLAMYNTKDDVEVLIQSVLHAKAIFK